MRVFVHTHAHTHAHRNKVSADQRQKGRMNRIMGYYTIMKKSELALLQVDLQDFLVYIVKGK